MLKFENGTYRLVFPDDRPFVYLDSANGERLAELFVLSSIHTANGQDDTTRIGNWETDDLTSSEHPDERVFSLRVESSIWQSKTYRFRCFPNRFTYEIELDGSGNLTEAIYFGGYYSGQVRWGSGFFWSGQYFLQGFNPEPNGDEINCFMPESNSVIDLMGVPLPGKANGFFTPPPFCFSFQHTGGWIGMGVEAKPGGNRFTEFSYHGQHHAFHLSLSYEGHTTVYGTYKLPAIGFDFASDEYAALQTHITALKQQGLVPAPAAHIKPGWWQTPIFCGWGEQCYLATVEKQRGPDLSRQVLYASFLEALDKNDLHPGLVVLDDKWQASYGENLVDEQKWPDLRGFIDQQHKAGRKVLLWLKAWDAENLPVNECITNASGAPLAMDPSNPDCEFRLRESVRRMLSPQTLQYDGYDADGFKIDFTARIPSGPGICTYGDLWGLELMKRYLEIIYTEAKKVKPDALIMTHTPHPYLAGCVDMIRLNDINTRQDINRAMIHRFQVASAACPDAIIDTDNWPMPGKEAWHRYLQLQPELGVPSLYYATHIDSTGEALEAEDYQLIREAWKRFEFRETS